MPVPFYLQDPYLQGQDYFDFMGNPRPGLSLDDLYQPAAPGAPFPSSPAHARRMQDLDPETRSALRQRAILQAALAFTAPHGQVGTALAAAASGSLDAQQAAIDNQHRQADEQYQLARQRYADDRQREKEAAADGADRLAAQNRLSTYQKIVHMDPQLSTEAEGAARAGDDKRLEALLQAIPGRQVERRMGYDPNDPFVKNRVEAGIQTDAEAQRRQNYLGTLPGELKMRGDATIAVLPEELRLRRNSAISQAVGERQALNAAGLLWQPKESQNGMRWEPQIHQVGDRLKMLDMNQIDPATGQPKMTDIGPANTKKIIQFRDANGGIWLRDPVTGEATRDPHFDAFGAPVGQPKPKEEGFLHRLFSSSSPTPSPPKASGAAVPGTRPAPQVIDQPTGAPAKGRGQGPAPPSPARSPLRGQQQAPDAETGARQVEAKTGPLPPAVRAQLLQRLAAGADPQAEIQHILQARGGQ